MPFAKGQRVSFVNKGVTLHAHVRAVSRTGVSVVTDDWRYTKALPERHFQPSNAPLPEGAPGHRVWRKGERIQIETPDRVAHATVVSGDMFVVKAIEDGGEIEHTAPADKVSASTKVLPTPAPSVMDDWSVTGYRAVKSMSEETEAFTARIAYKGKAVCTVSNDGHGGCHGYGGNPEAVGRLHEAAAAWLAEANVEHLTEAADIWVTWYATLRPYAVDAMEHLRSFDLQVGQYVNMPEGP